MKTTVQDAVTYFHFTKAELLALLAHMSTDETRPHRLGLVLDVEKKRAWATDGHRAAICYSGENVDADLAGDAGKVFFAPRAQVENAVKAAKRATEITVRVEAVFSVFELDRQPQSAYPRTPVEIPHLDQAMPKSSAPGTVQGFNASYLADLLTIATACAYRDSTGDLIVPWVMLCPGETSEDPMLCKIGSQSTRWEIAIMPVRLGTKTISVR